VRLEAGPTASEIHRERPAAAKKPWLAFPGQTPASARRRTRSGRRLLRPPDEFAPIEPGSVRIVRASLAHSRSPFLTLLAIIQQQCADLTDCTDLRDESLLPNWTALAAIEIPMNDG